MSSLERRYAEALFRAAGDDRASEIYCRLKALSELFSENTDVKHFFENPVILSNTKKEILEKIMSFEPEPDIKFKNFVFLLIDNKRIGILAGILKYLYKLLPENREKLFIKIFTSENLDENTIKRVSEKYRELYGCAAVEAEIINDISLLGGVCVQIGDRRYDGTLKTKIKKLREKLT